MQKPRHGALYYVVDDEIFDHKGRVKGGRYDPTTQRISLDDAEVAPIAKDQCKGGIRAADYCRMFDAELDDLVLSQETLIELGDAMMHGGQGTRGNDESSGIPAAYTYFGQFIAHEMTNLVIRGDTGTNLVTPTLDLGSIFGEKPIPINATGRPELPLGETSEFSPGMRLREDLPRDHPESGAPLIGDDRNDENTPLAQTHVAITKFFNNVSRQLSDKNPREIVKIVVQHFQSVVLHDYLSRLVDQQVFRDVIDHGRSVFMPDSDDSRPGVDGWLSTPGGFRLPIEFAMAFRFGHSMIRDTYERWTGELQGDLGAFWANTYKSNPRPSSFSHLNVAWVSNWLRILPFQGTRYGQEQANLAHSLSLQENPITAAPIDTRLAHALREMPEQVAPRCSAGMSDLPANLAARTLLRHGVLRLKDGRSMAGDMCIRLRSRGRSAFHVLSEDEVREGEPCFAHLSSSTAVAVARRPPLWFYVLREAKLLGNNGQHLGPLGSRIIMESIHAAIAHSPFSILRGRGWMPNRALRPSDPRRYTLPDLVAYAGHPWPLQEAAQSSANMIS